MKRPRFYKMWLLMRAYGARRWTALRYIAEAVAKGRDLPDS